MMLTDKNCLKEVVHVMFFSPGRSGKGSCLLFVLCFNRVNQGALSYNLKPILRQLIFVYLVPTGNTPYHP